MWLGEFSFFLPSLEPSPIFVPPSLLWEFYLALVSAWLGLNFFLLRCLLPLDVMTLKLQILRIWKALILQDLVKMYPLHFSYQKVVLYTRIQVKIPSHLVRKACWMVQFSPPMAHMYYLYFCTTLTFVLLKYLKVFYIHN